MRDDMFEIIIERPRWGSRMKHQRRTRRIDTKVSAAQDPDSLPFHIGLSRWANLGPSKSLNENLAPLRRYLERQVNRPWDKVWSEITANLAAASTVQQHVRDHVGDFVAISTFMKDGVIWVHTRHGRTEPLADSWYRLYVDPRTGILRPNKHYRSWSRKQRETEAAAARHRATRMRVMSDSIQVHKLDDDAWWEVKLASIPTRRVTYGTGDNARGYDVQERFVDVVLRAKLTSLPLHELYGRPGVYAVGKRQLSRKEVRDLGVPR